MSRLVLVLALACLVPASHAHAQSAPATGLGGGGLIAFRACDSHPGEQVQVWAVRTGGSSPRLLQSLLPRSTPCFEGVPDWSSDGRRLLIPLAAELLIADGRGRRVGTARYAPVDQSHRRWSPGRQSLTLSTSSGPPGETIVQATLGGRLLRRIAPYWESISRFDWSPDGRALGPTAERSPTRA